MKALSVEHPILPTTIGKRGKTVEPVTEYQSHFRVVGEVRQVQSDCSEKIIILQKLQFDNGKSELRLGYYILGKKPKMLGKWVWGQYATFMPVGDFQQIVKKGQAQGWF